MNMSNTTRVNTKTMVLVRVCGKDIWSWCHHSSLWYSQGSKLADLFVRPWWSRWNQVGSADEFLEKSNLAMINSTVNGDVSIGEISQGYPSKNLKHLTGKLSQKWGNDCVLFSFCAVSCSILQNMGCSLGNPLQSSSLLRKTTQMTMIMMVIRYETKRMLQYRIELLKVTVEPREICEYYGFESPAAWLAYHQSISNRFESCATNIHDTRTELNLFWVVGSYLSISQDFCGHIHCPTRFENSRRQNARAWGSSLGFWDSSRDPAVNQRQFQAMGIWWSWSWSRSWWWSGSWSWWWWWSWRSWWW